jgi:hypothetical protein
MFWEAMRKQVHTTHVHERLKNSNTLCWEFWYLYYYQHYSPFYKLTGGRVELVNCNVLVSCWNHTSVEAYQKTTVHSSQQLILLPRNTDGSVMLRSNTNMHSQRWVHYRPVTVYKGHWHSTGNYFPRTIFYPLSSLAISLRICHLFTPKQ